MSGVKEQFVQVELKYCERCGGLWLRKRGTDGVYCRPCVPRIAELPTPRGVRSESRRPMPEEELESEERNVELLSWCAEGGNA